MSAKVSRHIRQQRRADRKAAKQQRSGQLRAAQLPAARHRSAAQADAEQPTGQLPEAGVAHPATSAYPVSRPATSRGGRVARMVALMAGCGILLSAAGSAGFDFAADRGPDQDQRVPANYVAAPAVTERLVCPPTPGQPDSLSEGGVVEYSEREDSVQTSRSAVLFSSARGQMPSASWVPITHEGPGEQQSLHEGSGPSSSYTEQLVQRESTRDQLEDTEVPTVLEIQALEGVPRQAVPAALSGFAYYADEGPQTGLVSSGCTSPQRSQWFLGPETGSEATSLLTLTNPHSRSATVEVTTNTQDGPAGSLGSTALSVPAESARTINVAALTEGAAQLAVHVQASGAPVAAHVQSSAGAGTDLLPGQAEPQTEHQMLAVPAGGEENPQLWIHTPGARGGSVELQVFDSEGQVPIDMPGVFSVEAGQVTVVDVEGLEAGTYDVLVRTDEPALAAVRSSGDGEPVTVETDQPDQLDPITGEPMEQQPTEEQVGPAPDISWSAAAPQVEPGFGTLLPPVGESELQITGQGRLSYHLLDSSGQVSDPATAEPNESGAPVAVTWEELTEQAEDSGLDEVDALVVNDVEGQIRGGVLTREESGLFTIGSLEPITPAAQYVPLHVDR